jgi:inosine-uridine nucleoside N-ribohydrolase
MHGEDAFGGKVGTLAPAEVPDERAAVLGATVFCSGALTCVAQAIADGHPVTEVVWMGGAVAVGGNMTAAAEFNAWMDPVAADQVLSSGVSVKMVPLDVTMRFAWSADEVAALRGAGRAGSVLAHAISYMQERDGFFVPHDAVTAIAMTSPELFGWSPRWVRCETKGEFTTGETLVDRRPWASPGGVLVAEDADVPEVTARILSAVASIA